MIFDQRTISILKNFTLINPSLLFKEGSVISTISPTKTIFARATVPNVFEKRCAIYDLNKVLGGLSLVENPDITFDNSSIVITDTKSGSFSRIFYASENTISAIPPDKEVALKSRDIQIQLSEANFKNIIKAAGTYGLSDIVFSGEDGVIHLSTRDINNPQSNVFDIALGQTTKKFEIIFKLDNFIKLLSSDYNVYISKNFTSLFEGNKLEYYLAVDKNSTFID
jgi:hypothetical protein